MGALREQPGGREVLGWAVVVFCSLFLKWKVLQKCAVVTGRDVLFWLHRGTGKEK